MSEIMTIRDNLNTLMQTFLGVDYKPLAHATIIEKNSFKGGSKRFAVLPKNMLEVDGVLKHYTIDQDFEFKVTDSYGGKSLSDLDKQNKTIELQEKVFGFYKEITNTKANTPSIVIQTNSFSGSDPEYLEDDHVIVITATVSIKYRRQL